MSGRGGRGSHSNPSHDGRGRGGPPAPSPTQTSVYSPAPPPSSSTYAPPPPPPPPVASLSVELEQKLTLDTTPTPVVPPASSKAVRFPQRPGFGNAGKKIQVGANHFLVQVADKDLHHYDVTIKPEVTSKKVHRDVINQLVRLYSETHLGKRIPAYDGMKSLYTAGPLTFSSKEFLVKLLPDDTSTRYTVVGRSFFSTELGRKGSLGEGLEFLERVLPKSTPNSARTFS